MAEDRYSLKLKCPVCSKLGDARVAENDGWAFMNSGSERRVESVSEGFAVTNHGRDRIEEMAFRCECGSVAESSLS